MKSTVISYFQVIGEKVLKSLTVAIVVLSTLFPSGFVLADSELPLVTGEVKKIKPDSGKITIKHDPIPNLDMPGMTMVFRTEEGVDISQFAKGDNVSFTVVEKDGKMVILSIEKSE